MDLKNQKWQPKKSFPRFYHSYYCFYDLFHLTELFLYCWVLGTSLGFIWFSFS